MTQDFYKHCRESQEHVDDMLRAARRGDHQAVRALGRCAMTSIERAVRELAEAEGSNR
jgi:hypothetical protein